MFGDGAGGAGGGGAGAAADGSRRQSPRGVDADQRALKGSVLWSVTQIAEQEAESGCFEVDPQAASLLSSVVFGMTETIAKDLEAFAKHAKRTTIRDADVKLIARRDNGILEALDDFQADKAAAAKRRRTEKATAKAAVTDRPTTADAFPEKEFDELELPP